MSDLKNSLEEKEDAIRKLEEDLRENWKQSGKENKVHVCSIHETDDSFRIFFAK